MLISHISALNHSSLLGFVKDNEMQHFEVWPDRNLVVLIFWTTGTLLFFVTFLAAGCGQVPLHEFYEVSEEYSSPGLDQYWGSITANF